MHAKGIGYGVAEIWQLDQVAILSGYSDPLTLYTGRSMTTLLLILDWRGVSYSFIETSNIGQCDLYTKKFFKEGNVQILHILLYCRYLAYLRKKTEIL